MEGCLEVERDEGHKRSFPVAAPPNGENAFSLAELAFSGMSVIQNLEDSGNGEGLFFNRAGASFSIARFCGWNIA